MISHHEQVHDGVPYFREDRLPVPCGYQGAWVVAEFCPQPEQQAQRENLSSRGRQG